MSPLAQLISSLLCMLIIKSLVGAPTAVRRQRRQSLDLSMKTNGTFEDNITGETSTTTSWQSDYPDFVTDTKDLDTEEESKPDPCEELCLMSCPFLGKCDVAQCENYTCHYDYDDYYYNYDDDSDVTGGDNALRPDEHHTNSKPFLRCLHGNLTEGRFCHCDEGWVGFACNIHCTLRCVHGKCTLIPTAEISKDSFTEEDMFCNCDLDYENKGCEENISTDVEIAKAEARRLILGTCFIVVGLAALILPIVIWRKRIIFGMRTHRFFTPKEDNNEKKYDAYISAGTTDKALKFVQNVLAPKLEHRGFKLLIPCRDELGGAVISDNIITSIKQSRRIIMVVTPEYLQSDWSGFERLNTQIGMTALQKQIIPVVLEDVSKDAAKMQMSLMNILDSSKCLKVPGYKSASPDTLPKPSSEENMDQFWHCLELAMSNNCKLSSRYRSGCYIQTDK